MSDITLIGLGPMGSALGFALLSQGHELTVWNRTASKADALMEAGAVRADTPASAAGASPLIVVCLSGYEAVHEVLEPQAGTLAGRSIVNLSSGTPKQARDAHAWAAAHGIGFLSGAIMVPTNIVGSPEALFFYGGDQAVFDKFSDPLSSMGGDARYLGSDAALALLYNTSLLGLYWSTMAGFFHAAALVGSAGVKAETLVKAAQDFLSVPRGIMGHLASHIDASQYPGDAGRLVMDATAMDHLRQASEEQGIGTQLPDFLRRLAEDAIKEGRGDENLGTLVEIMRKR